MNFDMYDEQAKALRERVAAADKAAAAESAQGVKTDASGGGGIREWMLF